MVNERAKKFNWAVLEYCEAEEVRKRSLALM